MREVGAGGTGRLIAVEGIDGSGLTTHARLVSGFLSDQLGQPVFLTKEPTDGPAGAQVRLKLQGRLEIGQGALALLFAADRLDHLTTSIVPRLGAGVHVVCDRYLLSSMAYQGLDFDVRWVRGINALCQKPDLTIFLDVPVDVCLRRLETQRWRLEYYETRERLSIVRQNYLRLIPLARRSGEMVTVVPGVAGDRVRSVEEVAFDISEAVRGVVLGAGSASGYKQSRSVERQ